MRLGRRARRALKRTELTLETYGWVRGMLGSEETGFCLVGAVEHSTRSWVIRERIYRALVEAADAQLECTHRLTVMHVNDRLHFGRLELERRRVMAVVRRALGEEP